MAKASEEKVLARKFLILQQICGEKDGVSFSALARSLPEKYKVNEADRRKLIIHPEEYKDHHIKTYNIPMNNINIIVILVPIISKNVKIKKL